MATPRAAPSVKKPPDMAGEKEERDGTRTHAGSASRRSCARQMLDDGDLNMLKKGRTATSLRKSRNRPKLFCRHTEGESQMLLPLLPLETMLPRRVQTRKTWVTWDGNGTGALRRA